MAVLTCNFLSDCLKRIVTFTAIIPADATFEGNYEAAEPCKTLYLLHGLFGNHTDWLVRARVEELAMQNNLAIIMPSGDNSIYLDNPVFPNNDYGRFIGEELPAFTRRMFHLSDKREDTFIGGLSMGGFGAMRNGLLYNETFGSIISLSAALNLFETPADEPGYDVIGEFRFLGAQQEAAQTLCNPRVVATRLLERKAADAATPIPRIYMAVGTEDHLLTPNRKFHEFLASQGIEVSYHEGPGAHEWDFWNRWIERAVRDWLPLTRVDKIVDSGHVGI